MFGTDDIISIGFKLLDKVIPDPAAKAAAQLQLMQLQQTGELANLKAEVDLATGQLDVNKAEAANPSILVSGWRPFIGWVCGSACAWNWIGISLIKAVIAIVGMFVVFKMPFTLEPASLTEMMPVLLGLLGLGGLRTIEKIQGVAAK